MENTFTTWEEGKVFCRDMPFLSSLTSVLKDTIANEEEKCLFVIVPKATQGKVVVFSNLR
jgi:hypothetical protein